MRNIVDSAVDFIHRHRPERAGRFVGPYLVGALTLLLILGAIQIKANRDNNAETQGALCALRGDLEQRADGSREFLADHPEGFLGISASSIKVSLEGQERTVAVLSRLSC